MPPDNTFPIESDTMLRRNDQSERVLSLNRLLVTRGYRHYSDGVIDLFDEFTEVALTAFQLERGLEPTGCMNFETAEAMKRPSCGHSRLPGLLTPKTGFVFQISVYAIVGNPWAKTRLAYKIRNMSSQISQSDVSAAATDAFSWWKSAVPELDFCEVDDGADIEIAFFQGGTHASNDTFIFEGENAEDKILAHAYYPLPENQELKGQIHINDLLDWQKNSPTSRDLLTVLAHEIGHVLGIGHIPDQNSVMYVDYIQARSGLDEKDCRAIRDLYIEGKTIFVTSLGSPDGGGRPTSRMSRHSDSFHSLNSVVF